MALPSRYPKPIPLPAGILTVTHLWNISKHPLWGETVEQKQPQLEPLPYSEVFRYKARNFPTEHLREWSACVVHLCTLRRRATLKIRIRSIESLNLVIVIVIIHTLSHPAVFSLRIFLITALQHTITNRLAWLPTSKNSPNSKISRSCLPHFSRILMKHSCTSWDL